MGNYVWSCSAVKKYPVVYNHIEARWQLQYKTMGDVVLLLDLYIVKLLELLACLVFCRFLKI